MLYCTDLCINKSCNQVSKQGRWLILLIMNYTFYSLPQHCVLNIFFYILTTRIHHLCMARVREIKKKRKWVVAVCLEYRPVYEKISRCERSSLCWMLFCDCKRLWMGWNLRLFVVGMGVHSHKIHVNHNCVTSFSI